MKKSIFLFAVMILLNLAMAQKNAYFKHEPSGDGIYFSGTLKYFPNVKGGLEFRVIISDINIEAIRFNGQKYDTRYFKAPKNDDIKGTVYFSGIASHGQYSYRQTSFKNCGITIELSKSTTTANMLQDNGSAYFSEAITDNYFADKTSFEESVKSDVHGGGANWVKYWKDYGRIINLSADRYVNLHVRGNNNTSVFDYIKNQIVKKQEEEDFYNLRLQLSDKSREGFTLQEYEEVLKIIESAMIKYKDDSYQKELALFKSEIENQINKLVNANSTKSSNKSSSSKSSTNSNKKEEQKSPNRTVSHMSGGKMETFEQRGSYSGNDIYQYNYEQEQQRIVLENQQRFERNMKAMESASRQFEKDMKQMINSSISYGQFYDKIEDLTRLSNSDNPEEIIREFDAKMRELKRTYDIKLQEKINEINRGTQELKNDNNPLAESAGAISKTIAQNNIRKQKEESERELKREKRKLLEEIMNKRVRGYELNERNYRLKAAATPYFKNESYYLNMADYYQCCRDYTQRYFSIDNTSWLYPDCDKPSNVSLNTKESVTSKELFEASKRKRISSNPLDNEYADDFLDMAIKLSPNNSEYLYERSTYYNLGSSENLLYLSKASQLSPNNTNYKESFLYSFALSKKESSGFSLYLKSFPKGKYSTEALKNYQFYLDKETKKAVYLVSIEKLNNELQKGDLVESRKIYQSVRNTEFFNRTDVEKWNELEEYDSFKEAVNSGSSGNLIKHLKKYEKNGVWNSEVLIALKPVLLNETDIYIKNRRFIDAIKTLNMYLDYYDNDENMSKIQEMLEVSHKGRQIELIDIADNKMAARDWLAATHAYKSYVLEYPNGEKIDYAKRKLKKIENIRFEGFNMGFAYNSFDYFHVFSMVSYQSFKPYNKIGTFLDFSLGLGFENDFETLYTLSYGVNYKIAYPVWAYLGYGIGGSGDVGFVHFPEYGLNILISKKINIRFGFVYDVEYSESYPKFGASFNLW
jgi:hypothetical protein